MSSSIEKPNFGLLPTLPPTNPGSPAPPDPTQLLKRIKKTKTITQGNVKKLKKALKIKKALCFFYFTSTKFKNPRIRLVEQQGPKLLRFRFF